MGRKRKGRARVLSVIGGKGGIGKSNLVVNLAVAFARRGERVLLLDTHFGLGNIELLLGVKARYDFQDFLSGEKAFREVLVQGPLGILLVPAGIGRARCVPLGPPEQRRFLDEIEPLDTIDLVLIDTAASLSSEFVFFSSVSQEILLVLSPDPASHLDACSQLELLHRSDEKRFHVVVSQTTRPDEGTIIFHAFLSLTDRFFPDLSLDYFGAIPKDRKVPVAVRGGKPLLSLDPKARASLGYLSVADAVENWRWPQTPKGGVQLFWRGRITSSPV